MLPFRKRKTNDEEMELDEDDLVEVDEPVLASPAFSAASRLPRPATPQPQQRRKHTLPPGSRRVVEEGVEEDVAGQCLASIAAETSRIFPGASSSSHIRAVAMRPQAITPIAIDVDVDYTDIEEHMTTTSSSSPPPRLPAVTAPPFVRASAFVRKSTPGIPITPVVVPTSSVAPVSMSATPAAAKSASSSPNEPTVIVLRERPKTIWILAAAAIGALGAIAGTRLSSLNTTEPAAAVAPAAPLAPPPSSVVVPPASAGAVAAVAAVDAVPNTPAAPKSAATAAVVRFGDDQGASIPASTAAKRAPFVPAAPAPAPVAAVAPGKLAANPAPRGSARTLGPALPDGSFSLGPPPSLTAALAATVPTNAPAPVSAAPAPAAKRALTPEQQLAEAQLKASMK